ncbi:hypothetical protein GHT09_019427 [Marmota monax]|uniref:Uncharacterized protein n=1 Tax=Marmota monax TaxID=9995 RepID=A0A834PJ05_MARMO|nr:hypothetical protein GHT09_019427 [Marmota monax]
MGICCKSQRQVVPENLGSSVKTPPHHLSRVNGWSPPLHSFQVVCWAIFLVMCVTTFGIFIPFLPLDWKLAAYAAACRQGDEQAPSPSRPAHGSAPAQARPAALAPCHHGQGAPCAAHPQAWQATTGLRWQGTLSGQQGQQEGTSGPRGSTMHLGQVSLRSCRVPCLIASSGLARERRRVWNVGREEARQDLGMQPGQDPAPLHRVCSASGCPFQKLPLWGPCFQDRVCAVGLFPALRPPWGLRLAPPCAWGSVAQGCCHPAERGSLSTACGSSCGSPHSASGAPPPRRRGF